ncbi:chaperonin 10-like protein [Xylariales sp. PMI_506]|nr:chaperonin 10-like protein [Xylariales sp. PMI_506]
MRAVQVTAYNQPYEVRTVPTPSTTDLGPYDLIVKIAVASYCHTDSMVSSGVFGTALPVTASHEGSGTVVALGDRAGSEELGFAVGSRVMCGLPLHPCGTCSECQSEGGRWRQYCTGVEGHAGVHVDGFMAEYARVDARFTTLLPDAVSFLSAAPLACAGRTAWSAVNRAGLRRGQWLAIVGAGGGLGHLAIQFAKRALGLHVIGIDARDAGLEVARASGVDVVADARGGYAADKAATTTTAKERKEAVAKEVRAATPGGHGADATVVLADAEGSTALGCAVTRMHGVLVQVAQPSEVVIPFTEIVFRDVQVRGTLLCSPSESRDMVAAVAEHGVSVEVNAFQGLESIAELIEKVKSGKLKGKAVVVVDQEQIDAEKKLGGK